MLFRSKSFNVHHNIKEEVEQIVEKSDQAKRNKTMKNVLDASRGAQYKLQGNVVPDRDEKHKTGQAHNKAIGRALRNEEVEELDELSKQTIRSYITKASQDFKDKHKLASAAKSNSDSHAHDAVIAKKRAEGEPVTHHNMSHGALPVNL